MKKTLLLFLFFTGVIQAQVVNIPDENFKSYLINYDMGEPIDANQDGEIQVSEAQAIEFLDIHEPPGGFYTSLEGIEAFTNLTDLHIIASVSSMDLSDLINLEYLYIFNDELIDLNITGLTNLIRLEIREADITSLDLSEFQNLRRIDVTQANSLTSLTIGSKPQLEVMYLDSHSLSSVDLSECPILNVILFILVNDDKDIFINLKNGNPNYTENGSSIYMNWNPSSYKAYVCIDEGEAENFAYLSDSIILSSYCSFTPGGEYNTITGAITFDADGNGCDANDIVQQFIKVNINDETSSGASFTTSEGNYNFHTQSGIFTLAPQFENDWFTATPASATVNFTDNNNNTFNQNFCVTPNGIHPDVEVVIIPVGAAQPGFDAMYQIVYRNKGNQTLSGDITFTYDDAVLDYVSAAPAEFSSSTGSLVWDYTNLLPFESREIFVTLNLNGPMETPALEIGDQLDFGVAITPLSGDETQEDNVFGFKQIITGSFDPNDITCLEGAIAAPDKIGDYLHYNINFENTGNAAATFIVVKDMINEEQFDVNTLQLIYASHNVEVRVQDNKAEFYFDDIQLGPLEKGNLVFKIKTKNTLQVNDDVTQQANIYFDYNWPIETNEATTIFQVLSTGDFAVDSSVKLYPNPVADFINITAESSINSVQLYDVQGRLLQAVSSEDNTAKLDISARAEGMYYIKIMTEAGVKVGKIVKK